MAPPKRPVRDFFEDLFDRDEPTPAPKPPSSPKPAPASDVVDDDGGVAAPARSKPARPKPTAASDEPPDQDRLLRAGFSDQIANDFDGDDIIDELDDNIDGDQFVDSEDPDVDDDGIKNSDDIDNDGDGFTDVSEFRVRRLTGEAAVPQEDGSVALEREGLSLDLSALFNTSLAEAGDAISRGIATAAEVVEVQQSANQSRFRGPDAVLLAGTGFGRKVAESDLDRDGIPDSTDPDIDEDFLLNDVDPDDDNDFAPDLADFDSDGDGFADFSEALVTAADAATELSVLTANVPKVAATNPPVPPTTSQGVLAANSNLDGDDLIDREDPDIDNDTLLNDVDPDDDEDGRDDTVDKDLDGDGFLDRAEPQAFDDFSRKFGDPGNAVAVAEDQVAEDVQETFDAVAEFASDAFDTITFGAFSSDDDLAPID